jgi:hypothetical protein
MEKNIAKPMGWISKDNGAIKRLLERCNRNGKESWKKIKENIEGSNEKAYKAKQYSDQSLEKLNKAYSQTRALVDTAQIATHRSSNVDIDEMANNHIWAAHQLSEEINDMAKETKEMVEAVSREGKTQAALYHELGASIDRVMKVEETLKKRSESLAELARIAHQQAELQTKLAESARDLHGALTFIKDDGDDFMDHASKALMFSGFIQRLFEENDEVPPIDRDINEVNELFEGFETLGNDNI